MLHLPPLTKNLWFANEFFSTITEFNNVLSFLRGWTAELTYGQFS